MRSLFAIALTGLAAAPHVVAAPPYSYKAVNYVDTFDNVISVAPGAMQVDGTQPGALYYNGFDFSTPNPAVVRPASSPNVATEGEASMTLEGQPAFYPKNSSVPCFDLTRICYTCFVNAENSLASAVETCTIQIAGTLYGNLGTVVQELVYNQNGLLANMTCVNVQPTFSCLQRVDLALVQALLGTTPETTSFGIDNVTYTAYYRK